MLITGGAGFIGVNAADHFARRGWKITLFDNLSRSGTERNLAWIQSVHPEAVRFVKGDSRDAGLVKETMRGHDAILHLAAQVAVTTSLVDPRPDFEINALGTFNVLDAMRTEAADATLLFASTNKVYGGLSDIPLHATATRWLPEDEKSGVDEAQPLDFHSPYGCSKGAADQYVRDFARCYGLKTVVFRQSCIYGAHQYGNEDQGWVAHFMHAVANDRPITIYGDGRQVRDLLDVRDVCDLYSVALERIGDCAGQVFNIGGGPENARSVLEVLHQVEAMFEKDANYTHSEWREGDQPFYVSDIAKAKSVLGWEPRIDSARGLDELAQWILQDHAAASDLTLT
jgi:CDP-paratose 2-epimerase